MLGLKEREPMKTGRMEQIDRFAEDECRAHAVYSELAKSETDQKAKRLMGHLAEHEAEHYGFWLRFASKKKFAANRLEVLLMRVMRLILGLTFVTKLLERNEKEAIGKYAHFLKTTGKKLGPQGRKIIRDEMSHESGLRSMIKEERVKFISSIVLGLNDAMIELTGALVGFSSMLANPPLVAVTGLVTGVAASLSMAASAYMQASHEERKDARKAAAYTGVSYILVVLLLVAPFFLVSNVYMALLAMAAIVLVIIASISYYSSVIFERDFKQQFGKMLLFSVGVSIIAFLLGSIFRSISGISV